MTDDSLEARRSYWKAEMDDADAFMRTIMEYPVEECGEPMVSIVDAAKSENVEIDFSSKPHVEGLPRLYFLRYSLISPLISAAKEMNRRGWVLRIEDAYRTTQMQRGLGRQKSIFMSVYEKVIWECGGAIPPAGLLLRRLGALIANIPKVGTHMSGSGMDVSLLYRDTGEEVDRGGKYLELSEITPMGSPFVSSEARENRLEITRIMNRHGFIAYPWEFWHYNAGDAYETLLTGSGQPARYGAVDLDRTTYNVIPVKEPTMLLNPMEEIRRMMGCQGDGGSTL